MKPFNPTSFKRDSVNNEQEAVTISPWQPRSFLGTWTHLLPGYAYSELHLIPRNQQEHYFMAQYLDRDVNGMKAED
ncbi:predicted protein [Lichtheimia corymbifera JMRC:FSU:9682]|uniref:Uncharacterized protein n=1 Tax=Lichtheimia corymbifera JMRC:FSU:9682 TaxID=1263082 RepID=A0A068S946_9FUNG|nr:predicted protein [Lichtheimia corymbifera JMRC:FSU:9682]